MEVGVSKLCVLVLLQCLVGECNAVVHVLKGTVVKMQRTEWFLGSSLIIFSDVSRVVYADFRYHPYSGC